MIYAVNVIIKNTYIPVFKTSLILKRFKLIDHLEFVYITASQFNENCTTFLADLKRAYHKDASNL